MKCKEAYVCLLNAPRADLLPPEVIQHLYRCDKCRQRQARLLCLEQEIRQMPRPSESPDARINLLARLEPRPAVPSVEPASPSIGAGFPDSFTWRGKAAIFSTAAAILVAFGLAMGWAVSSLLNRDGTIPMAQTAPKPSPAPAPTGPTESVVSRVLEKHLLLAETSTSGEQVALLADMAGDLRTEASGWPRKGRSRTCSW